jgi:hypothetical protein
MKLPEQEKCCQLLKQKTTTMEIRIRNQLLLRPPNLLFRKGANELNHGLKGADYEMTTQQESEALLQFSRSDSRDDFMCFRSASFSMRKIYECALGEQSRKLKKKI